MTCSIIDMKTLKVMRLTDTATLPTRANSFDAGLDLYADRSVTLIHETGTMVGTGIAVSVPEGYVGLIQDRSSIGAMGVKVMGGVIDSGYTGEVRVVLRNLTDKGIKVTKGMRIAQLLIIPIETPEVEEVKSFVSTERGAKGFGSSGV